MFRQDQARHFPQATLGAVAGNGIADFFGAGESDADASGRLVYAALARLQHHPSRALASSAGAAQEIGADLEDV
jgi:hypothetical protein